MRDRESLSPTKRAVDYSQLPIRVDDLYGCWLWTGKQDKGYGVLWLATGPRRAYTWTWEQERGAIPEGKVLDHLCRRTLCVNPAHLEAVSVVENQRRKYWGRRVKRKSCAGGHDLWLNGRRTPEGGHVCLVCSGLAPEKRGGG